MVATLVRLRLAILRHTLRRERWRLVVLVCGGLWCLSMAPSIIGGQLWIAQQSVDIGHDVLVLAGTLLLVGWAVVPILLPALDDSLEIGRFATLGLPARRLVPGLLVAALLGVPTLFAAVLCLSPLIVWASRGLGPALVCLLAAPCGLVGLLLAARLGTAVMAGVLGARRSREIGAVLGVLAALLAVPSVLALGSLGLEGVVATVPTVAGVLGWTPFGAAWAAPAAMADGDLLGAVLRLAIAAGSALLGAWLWATLLQRSLISPPARGGRERRAVDAMLPVPARRFTVPVPRALRAALTTRLAARLDGSGWTAARAIGRRAGRSWSADPRYQSAMLGAVLGPVVIVLLLATVVDAPAAVALSMGPVMAASIGWGRHNDVALDGSAFWVHVSAAVPGWADRWGRTVAVLRWGVPVTVVVSVLGAVVGGRTDLVPAAVGTGLGLLCAGLGVSCLLNPVLPYPVPEAGASPFAAQMGAVGASMVAQVVTSAATLALGAPVLVAFGLALWWRPGLGWLALAIGVLGGAATLAAGIRAGGRVYDERAVWLLGRLR